MLRSEEEVRRAHNPPAALITLVWSTMEKGDTGRNPAAAFVVHSGHKQQGLGDRKA